MNIKSITKISAVLSILMIFVPAVVFADTIDISISSGMDDVEERVSSGSMYTDSSDLELIYDGQDQIVGLKFRNVAIPTDSTINDAYITFTTDETGSASCSLGIRGENNNNASDFSSSDDDVSDRSSTTNSVSWAPSNWSSVGGTHQTPDLSSVVQEIINLSGWASGNAMVFLITGDGRRTADSFEGGHPAVLHIDYTEGAPSADPVISVSPGNLGAEAIYGANASSDTFVLTNTGNSPLNYSISDDSTWLSCSPASGTVSAGASTNITVTYNSSAKDEGTHHAVITIIDTDTDGDGVATNSPFQYDASILIYPAVEGSACGDVPVYTENLVSPAILVLLDVSSSMTSLAPLTDEGDNPQTPDMSDIVQEIVNRGGWSSGSAMSFVVSGTGHRTVESYNGVSTSAPLLHVEYNDGTDDEILEVRVSNGSDDAEEDVADGDVNLTSSDLELIYDGESQIVGIRFRNVAIPQSATITNAYIEFVKDEEQSEATSLTIKGEAADDSSEFEDSNHNISGRTLTSAVVAWDNVEAWEAPAEARRIDIGKDVISDLVKDRSISWGYGSWCFTESEGYDGDATTGTTTETIDGDTFTIPTYPSSSGFFTRVQVGTNYNDETQQTALQDAITATDSHSGTPLGPSMLAAKEYFLGNKADEENGSTYFDPGCQPKILINITDGMGYSPHTSADYMEVYTHWLADEDITAVGVGFGLDDASQLNRLARVSNERGAESDADDIYALHDEVAGVGQPFLASSKAALVEALNKITSSLKAQVFYGSAPAPTTSVDYGNIVITAKFDATDWSGDLLSESFNAVTGVIESQQWSAETAMPDTNSIGAFTASPDGSGTVIVYPSSASDPTDLYRYYELKPLGDIINSTPIIVERPPFGYYFDDYYQFSDEYRNRPKLVYIGANDGALHAFDLGTGVEQWRFYPESMHGDLALSLVETSQDLCYPLRDPSGEYCHKYLVDGSPIAADVYDGSEWHTILVTGLGQGGASYFALDVTGGNSFVTTGDDVATTLLWELTDTDTGAELGLAQSEPSVSRVTGPEWGVFIGSGYSEAFPSDQSNKEAYLFGYNAMDKSSIWLDSTSSPINKIKVSATTLKDDALSSPLVIDPDDDGINDNIYTGNMYGTMYRVVNIGENETPTVSKLFDLNRTSHENPIRAKASFAYDESGNTWIYFGTGKYEVTADKTTMDQQYFVALKDSSTMPAYAWDISGDVASGSELIKKIEPSEVTGADGASYRVIENIDNTEGSWLLKLDNTTAGMMGSERVISEPLVVGGVVFFTTFVPDVNVCSGNGDARLYALDYKTGMPLDYSVFDINGDGEFNENDKVENGGVSRFVVGIGIGSGQPSKPVLEDDIVFVTTTGGGLKGVKVNLKANKVSIESWREL